MPPDEDFVKKTLVTAVVGNYVFDMIHEDPKGAVGRFDGHDAGVEDGAVVAGGGHLREVEEEIEIAENDDVGVNEDDLVVFGELP